MNKHKLFEKIKSGSKNIRFSDFVSLVEAFGFELKKIEGSHHIFKHPDVPEILSFQPKDNQVKSYQLKQFLKTVENYDLKLKD